MGERDIVVKGLRPEVSYQKNLESANAVSDFQNEVLRPILKFQNDLYVKAFLEQIARKKAAINFDDPVDLGIKLKQYLTKDAGFKAYLTGMTIAFFSSEEFDFYLRNQREVNKRIASMLAKRLFDQLSSSN